MTGHELAISARNVSKAYRLGRGTGGAVTAAEAVLGRLRRPRARAGGEILDALDDVSFDVGFGEAVGLVGRNGAGKSTLLKILTRITAPSAGRIVLGGRVGSLLEVGTGFHPELTGRENVFLNGTLLGMRRREIARRFDEIVDFAGVEKFLQTPVKRYSTGMYIRLAFAVAAHLESEILAVDEVLAVGDADFQAKCLAKMRQVVRDGRTVLLVSHQIATVRELCTSALYLERGRLVPTTSVDDALEHYSAAFRAPAHVADVRRRTGSGQLRLTSASASKPVFDPDEPKEFSFAVAANPHWGVPYYVSAHLVDDRGAIVAQCDSRVTGFWLDAAHDVTGCLRIRTPWLKPGAYTVDLFLCCSGVLDSWQAACSFDVLDALPYANPAAVEGVEHGAVLGDFEYVR